MKPYLLPIFCLIATLAAAPARAQPTDPILTLNTEMHTAAIRRISTDSRGRYLLTCSLDKTAKLWNITTGALLRTFRFPIGEGNEGLLHACALSPDGATVAVGGWTGEEWDDEFSIYIFDAGTGLLHRRITGLPNVIYDLEYSPDGQYLAATLWGGNGIRVYRASDFGLQAQDADYGATSYNLAFDAWGRLATVSDDGYVRLYDSTFKLLKKISTTGGKLPYSLAFSPDGRLLAVGYDDSPKVQVLDAATLQVQYTPDTDGATTIDQRLNKLAFSSDGKHLAAGGYLYKNDWQEIRVWEDAGRDAYTDYEGGKNSILDIKALPDGSFVFGGFHPDWGIVDPITGKRLSYRMAVINAYNAIDKSHFRLSAGGSEVGVTPSEKSAIQFSIPNRRFVLSGAAHPSPTASQNGLVVTDWNDEYHPKLNGKALSFLEKYEQCRSVDIATGGQGIVFGTSWNICCADADGELRWSTPVQSPAWNVNIDAHNQVVAATLADGTIRWYRFLTGELLLSLYLHPDNERWVLWTPSGYYDCAPGAEDLIGWHLNNGPDKAADYYPASRFRNTYYRPDVIDLILETYDEEKALARADEAANRRHVRAPVTEQLPPTVRILSPASGSEVSSASLKVRYQLESPAGEDITSLRIQVDGRPVSAQRGFKPVGTTLEADVVIPKADCTVSIIAENRFGASEAATVRLSWKGAAATAPTVDIRPKLYVLAIGVSNYQHVDIADLDYAAKDAGDFVAVIQKQKGLLYQDVQVRHLSGETATKDNILDGLDWLQKQTTSKDVAMIFFAGHGIDDNSGNFYFMPYNADPNAFRRTCLLHADVQSTVASVAGKVVVFMDACHSGGLMRSIARRGIPPDIAGVINELISAENGAVVFSSATTRQYALEDAVWGNGAFTKALVEGLSGKAVVPGTKKVTLKSLDAYISERVKALTKGEQAPTTNYPPNVPDFPIGVVK